MAEIQHVSPDGITVHYCFEILTLRKIRHWREAGLERCEAWLQGERAVEQRWYFPPLGVQGRAGHRYRVCWARTEKMSSYKLVGAANLASQNYMLCTGTGVVASMFPPSKFDRWAFSAAVTVTISLACKTDLAWQALVALPICAAMVGAMVGKCRDGRDASRSFDELIARALLEGPVARKSN